MRQKQLLAKIAELESRIASLERALNTINDDGNSLGLWEEAARTRAIEQVNRVAQANLLASATKPIDQSKESQEREEWLKQRDKQITRTEARRTKQMKRIAFPISREEALRKWLPKKEAADRMKIYRTYLRENLPHAAPLPDPYIEGFNWTAHQAPPALAPDEIVERFLVKERSGKCFTKRNWIYFTTRFDLWYCGYCRRVRKSRSKKATDARWSKKNLCPALAA